MLDHTNGIFIKDWFLADDSLSYREKGHKRIWRPERNCLCIEWGRWTLDVEYGMPCWRQLVPPAFLMAVSAWITWALTKAS